MATNWWLDLIFPKKCVGCGRMGRYVCEVCEVGMWEEEQICPICGRASRYGLRHVYCKKPWSLDGLTCLWAYEGMARKIIQKAKYKGFYDVLQLLIASCQFTDKPQFSNFQKFLETNPVVVPVPLHINRLRERGFNQAEIIATCVAEGWKLDTGGLLMRIKDTGRQVGRERGERLRSMEGAFRVSNLPKMPKNVLLVDDVWTTGATMRECAKTLKQGGAKEVWGLVLAR